MLKFPCHQSSDPLPSKSQTIQPNQEQLPLNAYSCVLLAPSRARHSEQPNALLEDLSTAGLFFTPIQVGSGSRLSLSGRKSVSDSSV